MQPKGSIYFGKLKSSIYSGNHGMVRMLHLGYDELPAPKQKKK